MSKHTAAPWTATVGTKGAHLCTLVTDSGTFTGAGLSESEADFAAREKAASAPCVACARPVPPFEARVSVRALGEVRCSRCRPRGDWW